MSASESVTTFDTDKEKEIPLARIVTALSSLKEESNSDEARAIVGDVALEFTQEESDAVRRKLDYRILPCLVLVYGSQFADKTSLNYSSILTGFPISGQAYSLVSLAFYVGFVVAELPTQLLAQRFKLAKYLGVNILLWSLALMLHAAVPETGGNASFAPFFALRVLLGVFESCVSPLLILLVASFYTKEEQPLRIAAFYSMNGATTIFAGGISFAVTYVPSGFAQWRILFILFGSLAFVIGGIVLIFLPDSPATATFLNERERKIAIERIRSTQGGTVQHSFKRDQIKETLQDVKTWLVVAISLISSIPNGGLSNFTSLLIRGFGYTSRQSLLLQMPGGLVAFLTTIGVCFLASVKKQRMLPILVAVCPTIFGAVLLVAFDVDPNKYKSGAIVAIVLVSMYGSSLAVLYSWTAANVAGSSKKACTNGLLMTAFGLGNIIGTEIFQKKDAPGYLPGKVAILVMFSSMIPLLLTLRYVNIKQNREKIAKLAILVEQNGWSEEDVKRQSDKHAFLDLTDKQNPFFTYTP